jgi:hypothetical protein
MKAILGFLVGAGVGLLGVQIAQARGFGGGFSGGGVHGGGFSAGGLHGGEMGGFHSGGFEGGASRPGGFEGGGFHTGGFEGGGSRAGGFEEAGVRPGGFEAGGYHAGGLEGYGGHVGLPTDGAFAGSWARAGAGYGTIARPTTAWSANVAAARGAAVRNSFGHYSAFGANWFRANPIAWTAAGWAAGRAWTAATWPAVGAWCGWDAAAQPVLYNYGDNVTYQDNEVYYGTQPVATADQYYQQAATLAQATPPPNPANTEWMPLGVFSLVQGDQSDSDAMFQLALNKSGALAGNYYSTLTQVALPLQGSVDKKTQRVAWTVGSNASTVYEAGLGNLTKDEAPVLVHLDKDRTQQWMLVRLKQQQQQKQE